MVKKFFQCLSLLVVLSLAIFGTAAAKSNAEITNIKAYDINDEILRIEISLDGNVKLEDVQAKITGSMLTISMDRTTPGRISKLSGTKIQTEKLIKKITVKETAIGHTKIRVSFKAMLEDEAYKMSVQPANRSEKQPAQVIIDVTKNELKTEPDKKVPEEKQKFKVGDKVIVLDAGHGGSDTGAVGPHGLTEKEVTLAVALKTEKILKNAGMKVVMTRKTDIDVASPNASNSVELQARLDKAPPQANLFISIHCNAFSNPNSHGMETYYSNANSGGQRLAQLLNEELAKHGKLFNRGVKAANFYVIKRANCPASLIELGFITNTAEEELLADEHYQNILAGAIANAVKRYFMN
ncbi:MAG: N-acetylmuramoyl-L-alanine amidase [Selenomonadaceae bacterium]|nr:N-acetylmuramoyl-L-alanine amidase [Selenomonadaceae bacterium]